MKARANLLGSIPAEVVTSEGVSRHNHLSSRRPFTADEVAVAEQEWKMAV